MALVAAHGSSNASVQLCYVARAGMLAAWPARNPNREDLLREATALVERIELVPHRDRQFDASEPIVVGFRADGALSIFFGDDPVYQFNAAGELRRAYCDGLLFKAVQRPAGFARARADGERSATRAA